MSDNTVKPSGPMESATPGDEVTQETSLWEFPAPYGLAAAIEGMAGTAAPLLAGFSIAILAVIAQAPDSIRWPGTSIFLLTLSAIALVSSVQFGFWARVYIYSRADIASWRPESEPNWIHEHLLLEQRRHFSLWIKWQMRASRSYNLGIVLLSIAIGLVAAPPSGHARGHVISFDQLMRWTASAIFIIAATAEATWIFSDNLKRWSLSIGGRLIRKEEG